MSTPLSVTPEGPISLVSKEDKGDAPLVDLFEIDGVMYQIPAKPRVNLALKYLRVAKKQGEMAASAELLEALLGEEGFEALTNYDDLEVEQFNAVMAAAVKVTLGALEAQGKSGSGSSK